MNIYKIFEYGHFLYGMSIWQVFITTVLAVFVSVYLGYLLGRFKFRKDTSASAKSSGAIVTASLGLLAFMLAFTFSIAFNRYEARKQIVLDEVNTIGTTYLRSNFLPDNFRDKAKSILHSYIFLRATVKERQNWTDPKWLQNILTESEKMQDDLWNIATEVAKQYPDSVSVGLFVQSVNDLIDIHTTRAVVVLQYQIPAPMWAVLYLLTILSFFLVGYEIGIMKQSNAFASLIIAFIFSLVIILITDLDQPLKGFIEVSQQPMIELQQKLLREQLMTNTI